MNAATREQVPHLFAGLIALSLPAIILFAAQRVLIHLEHTTIASTAPESFALKNQGLAFQRAAAHSPNVLTIYGSSELLRTAAPGATFSSARRQQVSNFRPLAAVGASALCRLYKSRPRKFRR